MFFRQCPDRRPQRLLALVLARLTAAENRLLAGIGLHPAGVAHLAALVVARRVERQGVEPGAKTAGAAKAADGRTEPHADILGDIFRIRRIARPAPGDGMDKIIVPLDQLAERPSVSRHCFFDEFRVQWRARSHLFQTLDVARRQILGVAVKKIVAVSKKN
ncbi:hypothetical protein D3C87_1507900 [compost metagenome]